MTLFTYVFLPVLKEKCPFRLDTYCKLLKDYKLRKPEKIYDLLENEPDLIADEEPKAKASSSRARQRSISNRRNYPGTSLRRFPLR
jgi:hypothetical protein